MIGKTRLAALAAVAALATPAQAAWLQATTRHFIVYANETPEQIRHRIDDLEAGDATLRRLHDTGDDAATAGGGGNRLTVYVTRDLGTLKRLYGDANGNVAGFYLPRSNGPVAFTPARGNGDDSSTAMRPQTVLMHEYGHHFLLGNYAVAYPAWFSEGYAEFVGTMRIDPKQVMVGIVAKHRAYGLLASDGLTLRAMFAPPPRLTDEQLETIYARGWALTHYLLLDPTRAGQLDRYLRAFNSGLPPLDAAQQAFGDLRVLDHELTNYVGGKRLPAHGIDRDKLPVVTPVIRPLSAGEAALIDARMQSTRGVNSRSAVTVYDAAARIAALYPDDAVAQGWFAEKALDAGHDDVAEAAADRALKRDPGQTQALLYKARIALRRAAKAGATPADWKQTRGYIIRANKQSPDDAAALAMFYNSYIAERKPPTKNAVDALIRAQQLVPQAPDLRGQLVAEYIRENRIPEARAILLPLAYDPHSGADSRQRKLLDAIDAKADQKALETLMKGDDKPAATTPG